MRTTKDQGTGGGDPSTSWTVLIGIVGAILTFVVIVGLQAVYYRAEEKEQYRKIVSQAPEELARLRANQQANLHTYRWIDESEGVVGIPIERAMELVVRETEGSGGGSSP